MRFRAFVLDVPNKNMKIFCLVPPQELPDAQLCLAFKHQSFLDNMAKEHGLTPFPAGEIDSVIEIVKKWMPKNIERVNISQAPEEAHENYSILHSVSMDHSCMLHCDTTLPLPLTQGTAVALCKQE